MTMWRWAHLLSSGRCAGGEGEHVALPAIHELWLDDLKEVPQAGGVGGAQAIILQRDTLVRAREHAPPRAEFRAFHPPAVLHDREQPWQPREHVDGVVGEHGVRRHEKHVARG